jgi:hypothetical protein
MRCSLAGGAASPVTTGIVFARSLRSRPSLPATTTAPSPKGTHSLQCSRHHSWRYSLPLPFAEGRKPQGPLADDVDAISAGAAAANRRYLLRKARSRRCLSKCLAAPPSWLRFHRPRLLNHSRTVTEERSQFGRALSSGTEPMATNSYASVIAASPTLPGSLHLVEHFRKLLSLNACRSRRP